MPFANLHKEGSTGNAAVKSFKEGPSYSSSQAQKAPRSRSDGVDKPVGQSSSAKEGTAINQTPPKRIPNEDANSNVQMVDSSSVESEKVAGHPAEELSRKRVSFLSVGEKQPAAKVKHTPASTSRDAVVKQKPALKKRPREDSVDITLPKRGESEEDNVDSGIEPKAEKHKREMGMGNKLLEKVDAVESKQKESNKETNSNMEVEPKTEECNKTDPAQISLKRKRIDKNMEPMSLKAEPKTQHASNAIIKTQDEKSKMETSDYPPKKKKKEFSPFRVKVGCVVAVRFRKLVDGGHAGIKPVKKVGDAYCPLTSTPDADSKTKSSGEQSQADGEDIQAHKDEDGIEPMSESQTIAGSKEDKAPPKPKVKRQRKPKLFEAWTSPSPGQDFGIYLLGRRIRCFFPKHFLTKWQKNYQNVAGGSLKRIVEGTVVSIIDNDRTVGLLVDRSALKLRPYLQSIFDDIDDSKASASELKRRNLEATIRGKDKVVVRVQLSNTYESRSGSRDNGSVARWVVATHVLAKPSGIKPTKTERKRAGFTSQSLFLGDENDAPSQQEENWRWQAGRLAQRQSCDAITDGGIIRSQLIGEVVKMTLGAPMQDSSSLATVTIRQLLAPHQTKVGRLPHYENNELFDITAADTETSYFQAPVEQVVVIGRRVDRYSDPKEAQPASDLCFSITHSYNLKEDIYSPLSALKDPDSDCTLDTSISICHGCRRLDPNITMKICRGNNCENAWCLSCEQLIGAPTSKGEEILMGPCCLGKCSCNICLPLTYDRSDTDRCLTCNKRGADESFVNCSSCNGPFHADCARWRQTVSHVLDPEKFICEGCSYKESLPENLDESFATKPVLSSLATLTKSSNPEDFMLPTDVGRLITRPSHIPYSGDRKGQTIRNKKSNTTSGTEKKKKPKDSSSNGKVGPEHSASQHNDEFDVFRPSCSRTISFEEVKKMQCYQSHAQTALGETNEQTGFREIARPRKVVIRQMEEKTNVTGRAARASQRRMLKSLSSFGDAAQTVDRLAGRDREEQLRFGRSLIHGWGVFATEPINAGDLIIEYRGELIGNAVADRRELEYERAKICDYMFRIDEHIVCDATKLGNVARYINASCSPNCYTQIITATENKRIVIYAKKDIKRGEGKGLMFGSDRIGSSRLLV